MQHFVPILPTPHNTTRDTPILESNGIPDLLNCLGVPPPSLGHPPLTQNCLEDFGRTTCRSFCHLRHILDHCKPDRLLNPTIVGARYLWCNIEEAHTDHK